jgi:signal transduction histidine kinase
VPDAKLRHHTQKILECVERLTDLSQDILDHSKVRTPKKEPVDLQAYLDSLLEPLRPHATERGLELRSEGEPCTVQLDPARFTRVMENLFTNALDAMADRESGTLQVGWHRVTGGVQIRVQDTGKGIPRKVLKRIFEPFFSHGKKKGTGLGMATVKKIVEEHGGTLEVLSEENVGTEVLITLPDHLHFGESESTGKHHTYNPTEPPPEMQE